MSQGPENASLIIWIVASQESEGFPFLILFVSDPLHYLLMREFFNTYSKNASPSSLKPSDGGINQDLKLTQKKSSKSSFSKLILILE